ncbi:MOSC domain-containing protein [Haloarcula nitratireducens]|uniref:MOSC N-terminal beta barrel domain-containing protein n=1 Tax=Haloarcula nitratireducens TaxID=2487749 RepID=A0AAW4PAE7_9EURY|nr:MOSC N-terminal beta barrel domain-containing protein [Halomicroarcula nitratireducens]MBX0294932.1 MOSC N-terminal beta barrel domain-containing protein [Halomicroarcula nitratireducens]
MAHIERLTVYPVKALDGRDVERSRVLPGGTLAHDREFALLDADGDVVNGKRTDRVHDVESSYDPETRTLNASVPDAGTERFELATASGRERAADWFGEVFGLDATLTRDTALGHVDRREMGPSVISTATLETVASWFAGVTVDGARRRLRANVEVGGVEAFWEDRFVGEAAPVFEAGDVRIEGVTPCGRCVVPERDPDTGEPTTEFRERFVERRRETFPEWADRDAFDHFYTLMLIARVPDADREKTIAVGDDVTTLE